MRAIRDFISVEAHEADSDLLVLATTRPQGYSNEFVPSFYRHLHLSPLRAHQKFQLSEEAVADAHPEWLLWYAVSCFAREPTLVSLIDQLKVIAQIEPDMIQDFYLGILPWQVAVCVGARRAGHSRSEIIALVGEGVVGTQKDWQRWEKEDARGVKMSQFRRGSDCLAVSSEAKGVMLEAAGSWEYRESLDGPREELCFADKVSDGLTKWPEIKKTILVYMACIGTVGIERPQVAARLLEACRKAEATITEGFVEALVVCSLSVAERLRMLGTAGLCPIEKGWSGDSSKQRLEDNLAALVAELPSSPTWQQALRAISYLRPLAHV